VVVAGNFAAHRCDPVLRIVRGGNDVHEDLLQTGLARYFSPLLQDTRWTYSERGVRQQVDHILISPALQSLCTPDGIAARTIQTAVRPPDAAPVASGDDVERAEPRAAGPNSHISSHERALVVKLCW
jgi:hypothetical protein